MPSNCSKAWVCANISRRSARMASVPWWSGFAPTLVPRSLQPLSGAARTSVLRPLGQLSGSLHGPRNDWPAPERQRPYQILKAPADGAGRPGNNRFHRGAAGGGGGVGAAWQDKDPPGLRFLAPEILKPRRTQFCVAHRVLNVFVAQVGLQRPSVVPSVRQCVTAGVPKDVRVNALELSCFASVKRGERLPGRTSENDRAQP